MDQWSVTDDTVTPHQPSGGIGFYEVGNQSTNYQYGAKATNLIGHHQIRYGIDAEHLDYINTINRTGPTFTLPDGTMTATGAEIEILPDRTYGKIYRVVRANTRNVADTSQNYQALFVQDTWKVLPNLTINPGLRYEQRHLWNPTNFGVCALLLLAQSQVGMLSHQWGNDTGVLLAIWSVGLLVVIRARVWHLTIGYLLLFAALAWVRTLFNGHPFAAEFAPMTGPMYTLFIFFMVTDPRTVVSGRSAQLWVLLATALFECAIRMAVDFELLSGASALAVAPGMFALFFVGPPCLWWQLRAKQPLRRGSCARRSGVMPHAASFERRAKCSGPAMRWRYDLGPWHPRRAGRAANTSKESQVRRAAKWDACRDDSGNSL